MRLNELSFPKTKREAVTQLEKFGWAVIGEGCYGTVLSHPKHDYVLKLFFTTDEAYTKFIELSMENSQNPHFPKFYRGLVKITEEYRAIRMEKLKPYTGTKICEKIDDMLYKVVQFLCDHPTQNTKERLLEIFGKYKTSNVTIELIEAIVIIGLFIYENELENDVYDGNIMWRGKTLVITDPVI
jgi:hypothetical protein